jgi:hypothetical protein
LQNHCFGEDDLLICVLGGSDASLLVIFCANNLYSVNRQCIVVYSTIQLISRGTMVETTPGTLDAKELLVTLFDEFKKLNEKIDFLAQSHGKMLRMQRELRKNILDDGRLKRKGGLKPDALALISLPAHLRKTVLALYKIDEATADELSNETKRLRAVESASANQLVRMGYVKKKQKGRKVYFYVE